VENIADGRNDGYTVMSEEKRKECEQNERER